MPDGSLQIDIPRHASPTASVTALVGNATGLMFRLREIEDRMVAMDDDASNAIGRHTYEGRALQRQASALVRLAVELAPTNMPDCVAVIAAAYEMVNDVYREAREASEMATLLESPMLALARVAHFLAPETGLRVDDFADNYVSMDVVP